MTKRTVTIRQGDKAVVVETDLDVESLPRRVAHAVHALMSASNISFGGQQGPFTAAEVCVYDSYEAYSPRHTAAALREAQKRGLAINFGGYWTAAGIALNHRSDFEARYLRETDDNEQEGM